MQRTQSELSVDGKCIVCGMGGFLRRYPAWLHESQSDVVAVAHKSCWNKMQSGKTKPIAYWEHISTYKDQPPQSEG